MVCWHRLVHLRARSACRDFGLIVVAAIVWLGTTLRMGAAPAAPTRDEVYQPLRVAEATLDPEGRRAAFTVSERGETNIVIQEIAAPAAAPRRVKLETKKAAVTFMGWVSADRLVVVTDTPAVIVIEVRTGAAKLFLDAGTFGGGRKKPVVLRTLGVVPAPEAIVLEVRRLWPEANRALQVVRLDLSSGRLETLVDREAGPVAGAFLMDRGGAPRLFFRRSGRRQRFEVLGVAGDLSQWRPLDQIVSGAEAPAFSVTPQNFSGERAFPLGFDFDPNVLFYASNVGRETYGIYALDLRAGRRTAVVAEAPDVDLADLNAPLAESTLVFDRARRALVGVRCVGLESGTRWLDAELAAVQTTVEGKFPGRRVKLIEWDKARECFLALVAADRDQGRYFIFHRSDGRCVEYFRRGTLDTDEANPVEPFAVNTKEGGRVTGYLTWPNARSGANPPLVLWFHDGPWERVDPGFQRDAQALAAMGVAVAQINYRGSAGYGRHHLDAIRTALDRVPLDDAVAVVARLAESHPFDATRIAVAGEGFGGYLAVRALQLQPALFSGGVAIDAPLDLDELRSATTGTTPQLSAGQSEVMEAHTPTTGTFSPVATRPSALAQAPTVKTGREREPDADAYVDFSREVMRAFLGASGEVAISVTASTETLARPVLVLQDPRHPQLSVRPVKAWCAAQVRRGQRADFVESWGQAARADNRARAAVWERIGTWLATVPPNPGAVDALKRAGAAGGKGKVVGP